MVHWPGAADRPEGAGRGGPGLQGKHLGLRKHSQTNPNSGPWEKGGKVKTQHPGPALCGTLQPRCGDTCGYPADAWCPAFCCHACPSPWPRAVPWKEMLRLQAFCCLLPGMGAGEVRGRGIFWFPAFLIASLL